MFTFYRVGCEPEMYMEDYNISYRLTDEPFAINEYTNDEGYDMSMYPVVSIDRKHNNVELYNFTLDSLPSDKPMLMRAILDLMKLKEELNIVDYVVTGDGANLYYELFRTFYIK